MTAGAAANVGASMLDADDFARLFGTVPGALPADARALIAHHGFAHRPSDAGTLRLFRRRVAPVDADFLAAAWDVLRRWVADAFLADAPVVCVAGGVSADDVAFLAARLRAADVRAVDLATHAVPSGAAVLTAGAFARDAVGWERTLERVARARPRRVVHLEPIVEWYDADDPIDLAAIRAHAGWRGAPAWLATRARSGHVEVIARKRAYLGDATGEPWSQLVWRPVG